jgi:hypothetical protein
LKGDSLSKWSPEVTPEVTPEVAPEVTPEVPPNKPISRLQKYRVTAAGLIFKTKQIQ